MGILNSIFQGIYAARDGRHINYQYDVIEHTPLLHSSARLKEMAVGASKEQKASIIKHMVEHDCIGKEMTGYDDLYSKLMEDF